MNEDTEEFREEQLKRERDKHEAWFEDDCIQIYYRLEATDSGSNGIPSLEFIHHAGE